MEEIKTAVLHKHSIACQCIQTIYRILSQKHWIYGLQIHSQKKKHNESIQPVGTEN